MQPRPRASSVAGSRASSVARFLLAAGALALVGATTQATHTMNDGFNHVVDARKSFPLDIVVVEDGPESRATSIELVFRGEVAGLRVRGTSTATVTGGRVRKDLEVSDQGVARMSGGVIGDDLEAEDSADIRITGGSVTKDLEVTDRARLDLSGGRVGDDLQVSGEAHVEFRGGEVMDTLEVSEAGVVVVTGTGFNYPLGNLFPLAGRIEGRLADGTPIDLPFRRSHQSRITLVEKKTAPDEPGSPRKR